MSLKSRKKPCLMFLVLVATILSLSSYTLLVNAADEVQWNNVIFGQSTSASNNSITINPDNTITLIAGLKDGSKTGGKIAGAHDGISYYYTEIQPDKNFELSATVTVNYFAKATPDNQEGFGIMARDAIGNNLDANVFASNMAMVGGYRGLVQSVFRNRVIDSTGAGAIMEGVCKFGNRPANDGSASYLLNMRKTNTGYHVSVDGSPEKIYYRPKQMEVLNPQIYVGFFAARVASITVSNIVFTTSDVATDPPGEEEPIIITPSLSVLPPSTSTTSNYNLQVAANVKGSLEIRQNGTFISTETMNGTDVLVKTTTLTPEENIFSLVFTPDPTQNLTSSAPISLQHKVTFRTYGAPGGTLYVAPYGQPSALGTKEDPIDIYSAVQFLQAGQTAFINGGHYLLTTPLLIERGNNGLPGAPKVLLASINRPVFDFGKTSFGLIVNGDFWEIHGVDITQAAFHGCLIAGNHNLFEQVNTYANLNTGLQISGAPTDKPEIWPTYNLVLNCTSWDNVDAAENNADGFAAKLQVGAGNRFKGCIAHNNCDDGYDLYAKLETGPIQPVTLENCIAYRNGTLTSGYKTQGDGNGFKLGGEGLAVKHTLINSLAFENNSAGVTSNTDPAIVVLGTTSVDNGKANFEFSYYSTSTPQFGAENNISYRTAPGAADNVPANLISVNNYFYNGAASVNYYGQPIVAADFKSLTPTPYKRKIDGNVARNDYMAATPNMPINGTFDIRPFSTRLISNPDFDSGSPGYYKTGIDGWHCISNTALNAQANALWDSAGFGSTPGSLQAQCITKGSSYTAIQLFTGPFSLEQDKLYLLTFKAKSSAAFTIPYIKLNQGASPWSDYATPYSNLAITTDWKEYAVIFNATSTAADGRLTFFLGNALPDGATFNIDAVDLVSYRKIVVSPPVNELLPNPGFDNGVTKWFCSCDASAQASGGLDVSDCVSAPVSYKIQCVDNGNTQNSIQLFTMPLNITSGKTYQLTFQAKCDNPFAIPSIRLMKATSPWTLYAAPVSGLMLTSEWQTYTITFTANTTAADGRLTFFLGNALPDGAAFQIDSLSLTEMVFCN